MISIIIISFLTNVYSISRIQDNESHIDFLIDIVKSPIKNPKIKKLKNIIDADIQHITNRHIKNSKLLEIIRDALCNGKRLRSIIAYSIIKHMEPNISDNKLKSVNAIELLHTSSLMIDDIMDNDEYRRGKKSTHIKYGNNLTLLTGVQLVMVAFNIINDMDIDNMTNIKCNPIQKSKKYNYLIKTAIDKTIDLIDGQFYDVMTDTLNDEKYTLNIMSKKTSSIFELTFIMSWIIGNGDPNLIQNVQIAADYFGLMFQIYDDFTDIYKDMKKHHHLNYVVNYGSVQAKYKFMDYKCLFIDMANLLNIMTDEIHIIVQYLSDVVNIISNNITL